MVDFDVLVVVDAVFAAVVVGDRIITISSSLVLAEV